MKVLVVSQKIRRRRWGVICLFLALCAPAFAEDVDPLLVGQCDTRGSALSVAVAGNYAYVADGAAGLQVIDISDPTNPVSKGRYAPTGGALDVAVSGNYAYVAGGGYALDVIDVRDPANPKRAGGFPGTTVIGGFAVRVALSGGFAYVAYWEAGLLIIDVQDPTSPRLVSTSEAYAQDVSLSGNYAYVADGRVGLRVIDVSDPVHSRQVGEYDVAGGAGSVTATGRYAYVGCVLDLHIIDIATPTDPKLARRYPGSARAVALAGTRAYVVDGDGIGVVVLDVQDPSNPRCIGGYGSANASDIAVIGSYAYLTAWDKGLQVIEIGRRANPSQTGRYDSEGEALGVTVSGNYAYLADERNGLLLIDVSNPSNAKPVGRYYESWETVAVQVSGNYAYAAENLYLINGIVWSRLAVINIHEPTLPQRSGDWVTDWYATDVAVSGNYAYLLVPITGLHVIDVSNPAQPQKLGGVHVPGTGLTVSGSYAYVTGPGILWAIDIRDPANPRTVGYCRTREGSGPVVAHGQYVGVALSDNRAYVADATGGMQIIDISDPSNPRRIGGFSTSGRSTDVAVSGNYVFVAEYRIWNETNYVRGGLEVIDVHDPVNPRRVSGNSSFSSANGVTIAQGRVFVAAGAEGLVTLEMLPSFKSISRHSEGIHLAWDAFPPTKLQRTVDLHNPVWRDVTGSETTNSITLSLGAQNDFFRLVK